MRQIFFFGRNLKLPKPTIGVGLILLIFTQLPLALNESLKLVCIATTWADYDLYWDWKAIPLDSRVRYCQGGNAYPGSVEDKPFENTVDKN